jgi:hypothetical protein
MREGGATEGAEATTNYGITDTPIIVLEVMVSATERPSRTPF